MFAIPIQRKRQGTDTSLPPHPRTQQPLTIHWLPVKCLPLWLVSSCLWTQFVEKSCEWGTSTTTLGWWRCLPGQELWRSADTRHIFHRFVSAENGDGGAKRVAGTDQALLRFLPDSEEPSKAQTVSPPPPLQSVATVSLNARAVKCPCLVACVRLEEVAIRCRRGGPLPSGIALNGSTRHGPVHRV